MESMYPFIVEVITIGQSTHSSPSMYLCWCTTDALLTIPWWEDDAFLMKSFFHKFLSRKETIAGKLRYQQLPNK